MEQPQSKGEREAGMQTVGGAQGVGKTYLNMHIIAKYVRDNLITKVKGRRCLIFDTNGEYTPAQFADNDIDNFPIQRIAVKDIESWCRSGPIDCRRVDAKNLSVSEKKSIVEHIVKVYRNGMFVLEDINTYFISMTHMEDIVSGLVNLRHRAVDVLISFQSMRAVEPLIYRNTRWFRMHFQADDVDDIKGKVTDPILFKIAQIMVNNRYHNGDKRFYVTIANLDKKVEGEFSKREFDDACKMYLNANPKIIKKYRTMNKCTEKEAIIGQVKQYRVQYYGN